jgi:excinuclease UvrABC nuclease subunit
MMYDAADVVLYVGKAKSLRHRLGSYRVANPERMKRRTLRLLQLVRRIAWEECSDETAALARESELLKSLKPQFNRAGVWQGPQHYLLWRAEGSRIEIRINDLPLEGWRSFGPFGSAVRFLRVALVRLLWYAINLVESCTTMPEGWVYGRMGRVAILVNQRSDPGNDVVAWLSRLLLQADIDGFVDWIMERTNCLVKSYDFELRDSDLDTILKFVQKLNQRVTVPAPSLVPLQRSKTMTSFLPGENWELL